MRLLILGGTQFLGRHLVEAVLGRGHQVTLFNRGLTNPLLFPEVERLTGDRSGDLSALEGGEWDAVVDTSGYVPRVVHASAELLKDRVGHYAFVSSISVYSDFSRQGIDEGSPVGALEDETVEEVTGETYGPLKALCERVVETVMPGRSLAIRFGILAGPHDPTGRFTYWVERITEGGEVLAPGRPERQVQLLDARDAAEWILTSAEAGRAGVFNATGPDDRLSMGQLLDACRSATDSDACFTWIPEGFLLENGVVPWTELPLWVPEEVSGIFSVDISKALAAGLAFRPLSETVRDTLAWSRQESGSAGMATLPSGAPTSAGMERGKEAELLKKWHSRNRGS